MDLAENASQELTLKEYVEIVRRRKWAVLETFGIIVAIGVLATALTTPIFRADAKLLVRATSPYSYLNSVDSQNPLVDLLALTQPETVETQIEVLRSEPFLQRVLDKSGLREDERAPSIRATRIQDTNIINVAVESPDPQRAQVVANMMTAEYLEYTRDVSLAEIRSAKRFVTAEHARARRDLDEAERDLVAFRKGHRVVQLTAEQESRTRELVDLESRSREAQNAISRLTTKLRAVKAQLAQEPLARRMPSGRQNPVRDILEGRLAELQAQREALTGEYRPQSPQMAGIDAQIARMQQAIAAQPLERVTDLTQPNPAREDLRAQLHELHRELRSYETERDQLQGQFAAQQDRLNQSGPWEIRLAQLTRKREAAEKSFLTLNEKLQDLAIRENARRSVARVIEPATPPTAPVRPRKTLNVVLAAFMGLILGLSVAFLQEYLDDRITTPAEADRVLGLPVLGHVPQIPSQPSRLMTALPGRSPIAESYRALRSAISFSAVDHPLRTLVVSSAGKGEGKSLTSMNLAIAMALEGRRVILVDADLRNPTVHRLMEWEMMPGLTDVLVGSVSLEEALREYPEVPTLRLLTSGAMPPNPAELVNSAPMEALIQRLAEEADVVLFDCPPVLPVTDAALLSTKVDGVILVADIAQARRAGLKQTKEQFDRARARLVGLIFNKVSASDAGGYHSYYYRGYYGDGDRKLGSGNGEVRKNGKLQHPEKHRALIGRSDPPEDSGEW